MNPKIPTEVCEFIAETLGHGEAYKLSKKESSDKEWKFPKEMFSEESLQVFKDEIPTSLKDAYDTVYQRIYENSYNPVDFDGDCCFDNTEKPQDFVTRSEKLEHERPLFQKQKSKVFSKSVSKNRKLPKLRK